MLRLNRTRIPPPGGGRLMRLLDYLGPFRRPDPADEPLPVAWHTPAVFAYRVAYRIDPLLAATNKPLPAGHHTPTRINGEVTAHRPDVAPACDCDTPVAERMMGHPVAHALWCASRYHALAHGG